MKKIIFFGVIIVSLFIINNMIHSIYSMWQKQDLLTKAQKELEREKNTNLKLKQQLVYIKTPQFVEEEARNKLFLVKPGEQVIVIPSGYIKENASESSTLSSKEEKSNWEKWWELFF